MTTVELQLDSSGVTPTKYDFSESMNANGAGSYTVSVRAGCKDSFGNWSGMSEPAVSSAYTYTPLDAPSQVVWKENEHGVITWESVENAKDYLLHVIKHKQTVQGIDPVGEDMGAALAKTQRADVSSFLEQYDTGNYEMQVRAFGEINTSQGSWSAWSAEAPYAYTKLTQPEQPAWNTNTLDALQVVWKADSSAAYY